MIKSFGHLPLVPIAPETTLIVGFVAVDEINVACSSGEIIRFTVPLEKEKENIRRDDLPPTLWYVCFPC